MVQRAVDLESTSQAWRALLQPDGYELRNANSDKCLTVAEDSEAAGTLLVQRDCDGSTGQLWRVHAGDVDPTAGSESVLTGEFIDVPGNTQDENTRLGLQPGNADRVAPGASQSFHTVRVDIQQQPGPPRRRLMPRPRHGAST
ncbi:RICIN domain-containing protein [Modestobacter sp. I12A-02662]|uniref:RICIN domain-containing protein n=1 Tax=Modestobacter sp. I12A-02662 TaxID=1730496 RepID=UPI0034DF2477